jgi:CubicO group peptidase (beta-lactamase class C family)
MDSGGGVKRFLLFVLALACATQQHSSAGSLNEKVDKAFERWDSLSSPGCALAVIKDARIVYERGYGMADLDHNIPIGPGSIFHVASISKQFTAAAIVLLAQEGKLSLDDEVRKYIPELPDFGEPITIRHLIHHTSGLRDQWELLELAGWRYSLDLITDDDVMAVISRQKGLNFKPGSNHLYCNTGYTLLGQIVKRVSGQSLREFTVSRMFRPLGMNNTHFRDDHAEIVKNQAYGYIRDRSKGGFRLSVTNFDTVGATSLLTTVEDLALWDQNFYEPRAGGKALIEQMIERGKLNDGKELDYAFGLTLGKYRGLATVDHAGADAGYRADLLRFPGQHFSVACLCNLGEINPSRLARQIADIYLAKELAPAEPTPKQSDGPKISLSEEQLAGYEGLYWNREDEQTLRIAKREKRLMVVSSRESYAIRPIAKNHFRAVGPPVEMEFEKSRESGPLTLFFKTDGATNARVFEAAQEFRPTPEQMSAYAGTYVSDEIEPIYRIVLENGGLILKRLKLRPDKLQPTIADYFRGSIGSLHFVRDGEGQVSGFVLNAGRIRDFRFRKSGN